jgi:hypothetical protein
MIIDEPGENPKVSVTLENEEDQTKFVSVL